MPAKNLTPTNELVSMTSQLSIMDAWAKAQECRRLWETAKTKPEREFNWRLYESWTSRARSLEIIQQAKTDNARKLTANLIRGRAYLS
jgi:hypothetical protein